MSDPSQDGLGVVYPYIKDHRHRFDGYANTIAIVKPGGTFTVRAGNQEKTFVCNGPYEVRILTFVGHPQNLRQQEQDPEPSAPDWEPGMVIDGQEGN